MIEPLFLKEPSFFKRTLTWLFLSGTKVTSTSESATKAYDKRNERLEVTKKFKERFSKVQPSETKPIKLEKKVEDKIRIPLAELMSIAEKSNHVGEIAMEIEKALIRIKKVEKDLAD